MQACPPMRRGRSDAHRYRYEFLFSSVIISPHPMITASTCLHIFHSFNFPVMIYLRRERMPLGISVIKVISEVSMIWLKNFCNRSGLYAAIVTFFPSFNNNFTVHNKINSSPRFLYDRLPTMRMWFSDICNLLFTFICVDNIKRTTYSI